MIKASRPTIIGIIGAVVLLLIAYWAMQMDANKTVNKSITYMSSVTSSTVVHKKHKRTIIRGPVVTHQAMPSEVRAIYMTACYAGNKKLRNKLIDYISTTKLNSVVIDIKDYTGTISIPVKSEILQVGKTGTGCKVDDVKELIKKLHKNNIYVIGRITVFQDPLYAKHHPELAVHRVSNTEAVWRDRKGLAFIDVGAKKYWDYIITLAKESHNELGFDELNFDYVRYPSDGNMADAYYSHSGGYTTDVPKAKKLEEFFAYLHTKLIKPNAYGEHPKTSADLFGMTTTNRDDLTIGQVLERAMPYFDAVSPMVYPSHYPHSFLGLGNPNKHVYTVVNFSMKKAVKRAVATTTKNMSIAYRRMGTTTPPVYSKPSYSTAKLRPWLQDFNYGGDYGLREVNAQIQANKDAGVTGGYMLWNPSCRYTHNVKY